VRAERPEPLAEWRKWGYPPLTHAKLVPTGTPGPACHDDQLGILHSAAIPVAAVLATVSATLLLADLNGYLRGRAAGRVRAATALRTE
jgi:hypothetical protein